MYKKAKQMNVAPIEISRSEESNKTSLESFEVPFLGQIGLQSQVL